MKTTDFPELINVLKSIDTPTICNAIEVIKGRRLVEGFIGMDIHCLLPELGTMVGYAITVTVDSTTPDIPRDDNIWMEWVKAMDNSQKPGVHVFKDVGDNPHRSAHFGEVMGTISKRLNVVGIVTDGGIRDILELKQMQFHCFAAGLVPSHGNPRLLDVNVPVEIDGVHIEPGDLIHGDINGVTTIPLSIVAELPAAVQRVREKESHLMEYIRSSDFSIDGLFKLRFSH